MRKLNQNNCTTTWVHMLHNMKATQVQHFYLFYISNFFVIFHFFLFTKERRNKTTTLQCGCICKIEGRFQSQVCQQSTKTHLNYTVLTLNTDLSHNIDQKQFLRFNKHFVNHFYTSEVILKEMKVNVLKSENKFANRENLNPEFQNVSNST